MDNIKKIVLIVTQRCNLNCTYCYENHKSKKHMTFEEAKNIIDNEVEKLDKNTILTIEFFGGEPFLEFDLIKKIVCYVKENWKDYKIRFSATTNGTLINKEVEKWLIEQKSNFECVLSLDGTPEMQNCNRPYLNGEGSYEKVNIAFFVNNYTEPRAKMTLSKETLPYLYEGVAHLHKIGFSPVADLAAAANYWDDEDFAIFERELKKLVEFYCDNEQYEICRMLNYDLRRVFIGKDVPFQYCGAGKNMITYDVDGSWYPCMALAPVSQGEKAEIFKNETFKTFRFSKDNLCKDCEYVRLCRNCYAANFNQTGSIEKQTALQCKLNRLTILASAKIQFSRLMHKYESQKKVIYEDELVLKAIYKINKVAVDYQDKFLKDA